MKNKWLGIRIAVSMCAALSWWGLIYPELTLTPDTVRLVREDENGILLEQSPEWNFDGSLYRELMNAGPGSITFRSRLLSDFGFTFGGIHNGEK